jgi:hypothetical protein
MGIFGSSGFSVKSSRIWGLSGLGNLPLHNLRYRYHFVQCYFISGSVK